MKKINDLSLRLAVFISCFLSTKHLIAAPPKNPFDGGFGWELKAGQDVAEQTGKYISNDAAWAFILVGFLIIGAAATLVLHAVFKSKDKEEHGTFWTKVAIGIIGAVIGGGLVTFGISAALSVAG